MWTKDEKTAIRNDRNLDAGTDQSFIEVFIRQLQMYTIESGQLRNNFKKEIVFHSLCYII